MSRPLDAFNETKRRSMIPLACLGLVGYYLLVFLPLSRYSRSLDVPLQKDWQKLAASIDQTNATSLDFLHLTNQLQETRQALQVMDQARAKARARLELGPELRAKISAPFQLVEYQIERSKLADDLTALAKQQQTALDPAVLAGYPEYTVDVKQPALLWAALAFVDSLLTTALKCQVTAIHSLEAPGVLTNAPPSDASSRLTEIPFQVELTGTAASITRLLQTLPLSPEEIRAAKLLEKPPDKPPLYLEQIMIKRQTPDKPDEVRAWLRVVGFVSRE